MFIISEDLQAFVFNLLFLLALLLYFTYINSNYKQTFISSPWIIGFVCSVTIGFCLKYSISPFPEYSVDMRLVPLVIGSLYGGRIVALFLLASLLFFRYLVGDDSGFFSVIAIYPFLTLCLMYLTPRFHNTSKMKEKALIALIPAVFLIIIIIGFIINSGLQVNRLNSYSLIPFYIIQFMLILCFVYFIERKRNETFLLDEINKLEKLRIVSDIAASISHEVRNPLTVTRGFLQLLKDDQVTKDKKQMYIDLSLQELDRADSTITDYLTFAKPSLNNIEILDLNKEINYIIDIVNPYALLHNVEVKLEKNKDLYIVGEKQKLHQCLINIAKNAVEAMSGGGQLSFHLESRDEHAVVKIKDTGIGMNQEQINRLGTPYYSTKDKGTGLGMMVVYSIVKIMGGKLNVTSVVGEGTSFTLEFPVVNR
ncbi:ATP-binding protein [Anaerobacillus isosaccharinicus]|uniref:histidine kinase n=1 Tax=Anaerobacillus isosaccharinicus TaxID=1532552 RepID=A0A1S2LQQ1_9BACI|nr:HAMP domain-containing sensor histidine kinase [Anaerobacillus isosaccharinicus]MBA5586325.1 HAMP domain-containing histidine kinase [Anaerobacillus isosaccharinicus]QOY35425.1 HAMP domain-containing histidine kinase [Anaerobacillus isosaccharinicus]